MSSISNFVLAFVTFAHMSFQSTVVIDSGSGFVKSGFAGENSPRSIIPNVIGESRYGSWNSDSTQIYVGNEALDKRSMVLLKFPMSDGYIENPSRIKIVWEYIFDEELRVSPSQGPVTLTYSPLSALATRDQMRSIMLSMGAPSVTLVSTALMTLQFSGRQTGLVIETGSQGTFVVPIYQGSPIDSATVIVQVAGEDISNYLKTLMQREGVDMLSVGADFTTVDDIKETVCYVAQNYDTESVSPVQYEMPWGDLLTIGNAQFQAPELLFKPSLNGMGGDGLVDAVSYAVSQTDSSIRAQLWANIVLGGGDSMFRGLAERLDKELTPLAGSSVRIYALNQRDISAWKGASDISS